MVFHMCLSDSKSLQVTRNLLCILADLNNVVVWMVPTRPLISNSSSPYHNTSVTVPRALITISINVTFMFFQLPKKVKVFVPLFIIFQFYSMVNRNNKVHNFPSSLSLFFFIIKFGRLAEIRWPVCMSKSHWSLYVSFSRTDAGLCIQNLFIW